MLAWAAVNDREYLAERLHLTPLFYRTRFRGGKISRHDPGLLHRECQPLIDPPFVQADQADHMRDDDVVLGFELDGEARAYPWWIMDNHHVANDVVGGRAVAVILCEQCSTGMGLDPMMNGRRIVFGHEHVYNGVIALKDVETGSVWAPYLAMAIRGRLRGTRIGLLPVVHITWGAWKELHPETLVLPGELGSRTGHGSDHTIGDPKIVVPMLSTVARWDDRLPRGELVLGVMGRERERVYPMRRVSDRRVIHDTIDGAPIVIFGHPSDPYAALAFRPEAGGRALRFEPSPKGPRDLETGSLWTVNGEAIEGPLAGSRLPFVDSHMSEWFVWAAHFPDVEIAD
jgi:hypothetical protein